MMPLLSQYYRLLGCRPWVGTKFPYYDAGFKGMNVIGTGQGVHEGVVRRTSRGGMKYVD